MNKNDVSNLEIPEVIEIYRKRDRTLLFGALAIVLIIVGLIFPDITREFLQKYKTAFAVVIIVWFMALIISTFSWAFAKCPRCGGMFFAKWYFGNAFALKCVHCGLSARK